MNALASSSDQSARTLAEPLATLVLQALEEVPARRGERQHLGPAVLRVRDLLDQGVGDQSGDLAADGRDVGVDAPGEVGDPPGAVLRG